MPGVSDLSLLSRVLYANFGGPRTDREKLAKVRPQRLWEVILNRRAKDFMWGENPVITKALIDLRQNGLEDPYEITPSVKRHVENLVKRQAPQTELDTAHIIFESLQLHRYYSYLDEIEMRVSWLKSSDGGLEIPYSEDPKTPLRIIYGYLIPTVILDAPKKERVAVCVEFSHLLIALLRAAGIEAYYKQIHSPVIDHAYVIAKLDGENYILDAAQLKFIKGGQDADLDIVGISDHYSGKGYMFYKQGRLDEAMEFIDLAIELNPKNAEALNFKGKVLAKKKEYTKALAYLEVALAIRSDYAAAWYSKGRVFQEQGMNDNAIRCFDKAIEIAKEMKSSYADAWQRKGEIYKAEGKNEEAKRCFAIVIELKR